MPEGLFPSLAFVKALGDLVPGAFFILTLTALWRTRPMIAFAQLEDMTAQEILGAWRDGDLDPAVRIVSVDGDLDNPRSLTYAWQATPDRDEFRMRTR